MRMTRTPGDCRSVTIKAINYMLAVMRPLGLGLLGGIVSLISVLDSNNQL
jgi:hypothetical protein